MFYLHIISGQQKGSSVELVKDSTYTIANNFDSDIYLKVDQNFECAIQITEDGIIFKQLDGMIKVNHELANIHEVYFRPLFCDVGEAQFIINNAKEISEEEIALLTDIIGKFSQDAPIKDLPTGAINLLANLAEEVNPDVALNSAEGTRRKVSLACLFKPFAALRARLGVYFYIASGLVLLLIIGLMAIFFQFNLQNKESMQQERQINSQKSLQQILLKLPSKFANLKVTPDKGKYVILGILGSESDVQTLKKSLQPVINKIEFKVICFSQIRSKLQEMLASANLLNSDIWFDEGSDSVDLKGLAISDEDLNNLEISISSLYPQIGQINTTRVFLQNDLEKDLNGFLSSNGLAQRIQVEKNYANGSIILSGFMPENDMDELITKLQPLNQKYKGVEQISLNIQDILKAVPFRIVAVYSGNPAWLLTDDGQHITVGGSYKGVTLISIDAQKIVLKNRVPLIILLSDLLNDNQCTVQEHKTAKPQGRKAILEEEQARESDIISREREQVAALQTINKTVFDLKLHKSLELTLNNIQEDLAMREHDYQTSRGEK